MLAAERSLGPFPDYLIAVSRLLDQVESGNSVDIYLDGPDHGSLGDYGLHLQVRHSIKNAAVKGAAVRMLLPNELARVSRANPQLEYWQQFERVKETPGFKQFFEGQYSWFTQARSREEMEVCIDTYMQVVLQDFIASNVGLKRLREDAEPLPFLFWRVQSEVIYVRLPQTPKEPAEARWTSTAEDVDLFVSRFTALWNGGIPILNRSHDERR
jgi:hypothetical protein